MAWIYIDHGQFYGLAAVAIEWKTQLKTYLLFRPGFRNPLKIYFVEVAKHKKNLCGKKNILPT